MPVTWRVFARAYEVQILTLANHTPLYANARQSIYKQVIPMATHQQNRDWNTFDIITGTHIS